MKKLVLAVVMLMVLVGTVSAEPIILKYATFEPPQAFAIKKIWQPWIDQMNKAGEGLFKIELFAGGTLNRNPVKQLNVVRDGVADIAFVMPSYTPGTFMDDSVVEVPFIGETALQASLAIHRMYEKGMLRNYDIIVPLMVAAGQQYAVHSTMPVKVPQDLNGKKIRSTGKMQHYMAQAYGAAPIGMPVTKIAESMSRGLIQATTNEWNGTRTFKIDNVAHYHCMLPLGTVSFLLAMNKEKFDSLPKKAQDIFIQNREATARLWGSEMDKSLDAYQKKVEKDPKQHVYFPTPDEVAVWKKVLAPAIESWEKDDPKRVELLKAYKEEIAKAEK
jgi:TRAP-type C4-dicarboxylate transport system substrate-binding protein